MVSPAPRRAADRNAATAAVRTRGVTTPGPQTPDQETKPQPPAPTQQERGEMRMRHQHNAAPAGSRPPHTPVPRRRGALLRLTGLLFALLLAVAACSSGSGSSSKSSSPATPPATTTAPASPSASPNASATGTAPADPAAAKASITANWEKFFDPATSLPDKAALLQNGEQLAPVLQGFASDPRVGQVKATVTNVQFTSATTAAVTYSLSLQGAVVQPDASGQAVLENGTWKVSTSTLCGLVQLSGGATTAVPGCS
ncbi:hypothetical protein AB0K51_00640 [Kitasatospora sp. NPDC049285]|uniref:hypothetical protein n=1 Tax=Kitasatospora sp. NPDC049285 TaxID=3157096 RepID=UPI003418EE39